MVENNAIDHKDMDTSVSPGENFYQYANGGWIENNPLTEEYSRFGTFDKLQEENNKQVKEIIHTLTSSKSEDYTDQLVGKFYAQGMDIDTIEQQNIEALTPYLKQVASISSFQEAIQVITEFHKIGISPFYSAYATPDKKNSNWNIIGIWQGGLGMNDRDYYLNTDQRTLDIQKAYKKYIKTLFEFIGESSPKAELKSTELFEFEKVLAENSMSRLEMRDPQLTYNKMDLAGLADIANFQNWDTYFSAMGIQTKNEITVGQIAYFKFITNFLKSTSLETLKNYLTFYLASSSAPFLSNHFVEASFAFYGKVMQGTEKLKPRWKRMIGYTNIAVGEALGKAYVKKYFPPASKTRMESLVDNLIQAFEKRIQQLDWMTESTKLKAIDKLGTINVKIGYPNKWRDYSNLKLDSPYFLQNVIEARINNKAHQLSKIGQEVDPEEWLMLPHTVNAYYHPIFNEIVFPAAILQPPFFFADADDAVNYGAIGVVIGHEITHGFDDKGRQYDKEGMLNNWWSETDTTQFNKKTDVLVNLFNSFKVTDDIYANGKLTLGENIADLGGLQIALSALKTTSQYQQAQPIKSYTPPQRFFLAYAHLWANSIRSEEMLRRVKEDVHSLGEHRVNGPLPNIEDFYEAFNLSNTDKLYVPVNERAHIW